MESISFLLGDEIGLRCIGQGCVCLPRPPSLSMGIAIVSRWTAKSDLGSVDILDGSRRAV